jgi:hypothetical protein
LDKSFIGHFIQILDDLNFDGLRRLFFLRRLGGQLDIVLVIQEGKSNFISYLLRDWFRFSNVLADDLFPEIITMVVFKLPRFHFEIIIQEFLGDHRMLQF